MQKNFQNNDDTEQISEWLHIYHTTDSKAEKTRVQTLIVTQMVPVVKKIARTIARRSYDPVDDLIQAGFIGLLKAIDNYSRERNDNFRVYAGYLIIGEMKHYVRDKLNMIRVPAYIHELTIRIANFTKDLTIEEVQNLTSDEMASALDVSPKAVDLALEVERRSSTVSLDGLRAQENNLSYEEFLAPENYKDIAEFEDSRIIFEDVITKLPPNEQVIIDMYYKQDMNKKQIAEALLITPRDVSKQMKSAFEIIAKLVMEKQEQLHNLKNGD